MAVELNVTVKSGNEAFKQDAGAEVARILRALADMVGAGEEGYFRLMDHNGNGVGRATLEVWED
jgi:hypothetical protein